jgi:hypothetical protein
VRGEHRLTFCGKLRCTQLRTGAALHPAAVPRLPVLNFDFFADGALIVVVIDVSVSLPNRMPRWCPRHCRANLMFSTADCCDLSHREVRQSESGKRLRPLTGPREFRVNALGLYPPRIHYSAVALPSKEASQAQEPEKSPVIKPIMITICSRDRISGLRSNRKHCGR